MKNRKFGFIKDLLKLLWTSGKLQLIKKSAIKKVYEVMNNADYQGTIPYFSLFISDCIGPTPLPNHQSNAGVLQ